METTNKIPNNPPPQYEPHPLAPPQWYSTQQGYSQNAESTVVIQQPIGINGATYRFGQIPAVIVCQNCQATVTTTMTYETGLLTWAAAGVICLLLCWCGCCLIPFCMKGTKDVNHTCPNCQNVVGKFRHFN